MWDSVRGWELPWASPSELLLRLVWQWPWPSESLSVTVTALPVVGPVQWWSTPRQQSSS